MYALITALLFSFTTNDVRIIKYLATLMNNTLHDAYSFKVHFVNYPDTVMYLNVAVPIQTLEFDYINEAVNNQTPIWAFQGSMFGNGAYRFEQHSGEWFICVGSGYPYICKRNFSRHNQSATNLTLGTVSGLKFTFYYNYYFMTVDTNNAGQVVITSDGIRSSGSNILDNFLVSKKADGYYSYDDLNVNNVLEYSFPTLNYTAWLSVTPQYSVYTGANFQGLILEDFQVDTVAEDTFDNDTSVDTTQIDTTGGGGSIDTTYTIQDTMFSYLDSMKNYAKAFIDSLIVHTFGDYNLIFDVMANTPPLSFDIYIGHGVTETVTVPQFFMDIIFKIRSVMTLLLIFVMVMWLIKYIIGG